MADDVTPIKPPRKGKPRQLTIVAAVEDGSREHELRVQGKSWTQIAKALGHANPHVAQTARSRYLQRAALALAAEKRAEALQLEVERLDELQASHWDAAVTGYETEEGPRRPDVKAAEFVLKVIGLRAKLMGLEVADQSAQGPRTVVITGNTDQYVAGLKDLIAGETVVVDADVVDED